MAFLLVNQREGLEMKLPGVSVWLWSHFPSRCWRWGIPVVYSPETPKFVPDEPLDEGS